MEPIRYEIDGTIYTLNSVGNDDLSPHDVHVLHVYQDPDFLKELTKLRRLHDNDISQAIVSDGSTRSDAVQAFFKPLADSWHITPSEVSNAYMNSSIASKRLVRISEEQPMLIDWNALLNESRFTVDFNLLKLRKTDLEELWKIVEQRKSDVDGGKHKRNRSSENDKLVYAIFKARKNKRTFTQIYNDYLNGTLAGYKGNTALNSADTLARYYRKYAP